MIENVYKNQPEYDEVTSEFETSLQLSKEHSLFSLKADSLNGLGNVCERKGEYRAAHG